MGTNNSRITLREWVGGGMLVGVLVAGYWLVQVVGGEPPDRQSPPPGERTGPKVSMAADDVRATNRKLHGKETAELVDPGPLPSSLAGAEPDVRLQTDANGQLVPTYGLMVLFDFYLAGLADEPLDRVLTRIHLALSVRLEGVALEDARDLLRRYVDYRVALLDLGGAGSGSTLRGGFSATALQQRLQGLESLRDSLFTDAESTAFFQLERVQDEYSVARLAIEQDATLNDRQRQRAIAELDRQLPAGLRALRQRVTRDANLYATTESLREQGAGAEAIYQVRAQALGDEAAANLAKLDQQREQWRQRLSAYAEQRNRIRQSGLSPEDQRVAVEDLLERNFSTLEQRRVRALDAEL